jgi:flagellar basal-body rod protein FlgB
MAIADIPILSMIRTRLEWNQERQRVLAENVANSDTPHFRPRDLAEPKFETTALATTDTVSTVSLSTTDSGHIAGMSLGASSFHSESAGNYEVKPTGNAVSLEDEMMKVASNQMDYEAVTALYTRSLNLLKTALGKH